MPSRNGVRPVLQRLADGRRKERFRSYLQNLLSSGLPVLPYDHAAALWHGEQCARLEARGLRPGFADGQIASIAATQGAVTLRQLNHRCGPLTGATTAQLLAGGKHLRRPL